MEPITALSGWLQTLLGLAGRAVLLTMFPEVAVLHFRRRTLRLRESRMAFLAMFLRFPFRSFVEFLGGGVANGIPVEVERL